VRRLPVVLALTLALAAAACSAAATTAPTGSAAPASGVATSGVPAPSAAPLAGPITSSGPVGWNRGPYELAGGSYELTWESDGSCTILYFGIVGVDNGYKEDPPTAGDVPMSQIKGGSRTIENVPAGSYYFNVSGIACKTYRGTLTPKR